MMPSPSRRRRRFLAAFVICLGTNGPAPASAGDWDLNVGRLCVLRTGSGRTLNCGGGYTAAMAQSDPLDSRTPVLPDNAAFRSLMSELGAVFAPNILYASDTRGWSGFNVSSEFGWTQVSSRKAVTDPVNQPNYIWRAARSVSSRAFTDPTVRDDTRYQQELPPSMAPTITVMMRKGLWIPVPSFELGLGVRHLIGSTMWAPLVTAKIALHEGYHGWPIPSLAVRGMGSRVMNTPGFNLTLAALDFSVSKRVGIASVFNLTPYAGYQLLWIMAGSGVIDATPAIDAVQESAKLAGNDPIRMAQCAGEVADCRANFTFDTQSTITRHRLFVGLKASFYILSLTAEYTFFASGSTSDQISSEVAGLPTVVADGSGTQHTVSFSLGLDY